MKQFLEIGQIVSIHGIKGEVRVNPWCNGPEFLCKFKTLYFDENTPVKINSAKRVKNVCVLKLEGVDTPENAQALRNKILYINRSDVKLPKGEYFIQDLIDLKVYDSNTDMYYGKICEVTSTGANDVYHIKNEDKINLIPAIPQVIDSIDIENGIMKITPIKGLFDD
ncbi:MAG: ribosome maturation factor RimM [Oscillospiraceae bacterium]